MLWKIYDDSSIEQENLSEKFPSYFIEAVKYLKAKDFDIKVAINNFHENLILFECDFPEFHTYYAPFLIKLINENLISCSDIDFKSNVPNKDEYIPTEVFVKIIMMLMDISLIEQRYEHFDSQFNFK